jgi:hypothetical protein
MKNLCTPICGRRVEADACLLPDGQFSEEKINFRARFRRPDTINEKTKVTYPLKWSRLPTRDPVGPHENPAPD